MNYTKNYHLPQWEETDRIMMNDFNQMCLDIESGIDSAKAESTTSSQALSERVTAAQTAASAAQTAANNAKTAADTAQTAANAAQTTATAAQTAANNAKTAADNAQATANAAQTTANAAQTTANTAKTAADNAQTTADTAQTTAAAAQTAANNAKASAETCKIMADNAKGTADIALAKANNAYSPDQPPFFVGSYVGTGSNMRIHTGFRPSFLIISGQTIEKATPAVLLATGDVDNGLIAFHGDYFAIYPAVDYYPNIDLKGRTYYFIAFR